MKPETFDIIRQTVPVLEQHGEHLADCFYKNMFRHNPEVISFFNPAHLHAGVQQRALATAICTYAQHADNPERLRQAIELIAHKHVSLGIKPEHYPIVGSNLLLTLREVLGEAATTEVIDAWAEAYAILAGIFIDREDALYQQQLQQGWHGFKAFRLNRRQAESSCITSFYLQPIDNKPLPHFLPGQYVTLKVTLADGSEVMRNYSLSAAPREDYFRISVKRETDQSGKSSFGSVSNHLHNRFNVGDQVLVGPPCGEFSLKPSNLQQPIVFIAGGVGITPLLAMLHSGLTQDRQSSFILIQLARNHEELAFYQELSVLAKTYSNFDWHICLSQPATASTPAPFEHSEGYLDEALLKQLLPDPRADYYLCGPPAMMQATKALLQRRGVEASAIYAEFFGPMQSLG